VGDTVLLIFIVHKPRKFANWLRFLRYSLIQSPLILQTVNPKTDEQRKKLQEAVRKILIFKALDNVRSVYQVECCSESFTLLSGLLIRCSLPNDCKFVQ